MRTFSVHRARSTQLSLGLLDAANGPLIVTGMHRSRTSVVTLVLERVGLDVGTELLPADERNPTGYAEDRRFVELHGRMLSEACGEATGGHPDWGWVPRVELDRRTFDAHIPEARRLLTHDAARPWGWKDPRATMALDFWLGVAPDARFVLVYRRPDEVVRSMSTLPSDVLSQAAIAHRVWFAYNDAVRRFTAAHRERVVLVDGEVVMHEPAWLVAMVADRLHIPLDVDGARAAADELLRRDRGQAAPGPVDAPLRNRRLLRQLDRLADWSPRAEPSNRTPWAPWG